MSDFELNDLFLFRIVIDGRLHFRDFLTVIPQEFSTHRGDMFREFFDAQPPHAEVGFMDPLVADITVAIVPVPVPVVMHEVLRERSHGSRSAPEIVVKSLGDRGDALVSDVTAAAEDQSARHIYPADESVLQMVHRFADGQRTAQLHAVLYDAVIFIGRLDHLFAFMDIMRSRFLHIHILSGLAGPDRLQRMPVVGGGQGDGIDVLIFKEPSEILLNAHFHAEFLLQFGGSFLGQGEVRIGDGG